MGSIRTKWAAKKATYEALHPWDVPAPEAGKGPRTADQRRAELRAVSQAFYHLRISTGRGRVTNGFGRDYGPLAGARAEIAVPATPPASWTAVVALSVFTGGSRIGRPGRVLITFPDGSYLERKVPYRSSKRFDAEIGRFNMLAALPG